MPRILLVDDSLTYLAYCTQELQEEGYEISTAMDGQEALGLVEQQKPDAVVLDISMPILDGVSLLQLIRQRHPETVLILHSAHGEYRHAYETWSANAFVEKSTDLSELRQTIRRHLKLAGAEVA